MSEQRNYVGVKAVAAFPEEKEGRAGYAVFYENGYQSWSPKEVFEKFYIEVGSQNKIAPDNVKDFIKSVEITKIGEKTTLVRATLANGFEIIEYSSCVDPRNYDEELGTKYAMQKVENKVWELLGFLLQTANNGVNASFEKDVCDECEQPCCDEPLPTA